LRELGLQDRFDISRETCPHSGSRAQAEADHAEKEKPPGDEPERLRSSGELSIIRRVGVLRDVSVSSRVEQWASVPRCFRCPRPSLYPAPRAMSRAEVDPTRDLPVGTTCHPLQPRLKSPGSLCSLTKKDMSQRGDPIRRMTPRTSRVSSVRKVQISRL
jgi:hypothetical protein